MVPLSVPKGYGGQASQSIDVWTLSTVTSRCVKYFRPTTFYQGKSERTRREQSADLSTMEGYYCHVPEHKSRHACQCVDKRLKKRKPAQPRLLKYAMIVQSHLCSPSMPRVCIAHSLATTRAGNLVFLKDKKDHNGRPSNTKCW